MICRSTMLMLADPLTRLLRPLIAKSMEKTIKRKFAIGILLAALAIAGSVKLSAQDEAPFDWHPYLVPDGETVYDVGNTVTWLADANLAGKTLPDGGNFRFGLPLCDPLIAQTPGPCVNASGSMSYTSAKKWVAGMNAFDQGNGYLGHHDWQLPTTWHKEFSCADHGPEENDFGFGCDDNALGYLYYNALGIEAPNTAVPIPTDTVGPFRNFQPALYWSNHEGDGTNGSVAVFSFASGAQGGSTRGDFLFLLPMINGKTSDTTAISSTGLQPSSDGMTVYDPRTNVTWLADANLAASVSLGLPPCQTPTAPTLCIAEDGSMDYASAEKFIANMNTYVDPATGDVGYLHQTNWSLPPVDPGCPTYNCDGPLNPMGELFYLQLGKTAGEPVVKAPDIAVGPFHHVQPSQYWSCVAKTIQDACEIDGESGEQGAEFGFSFGDGFLGTTGKPAYHFVTAYYVGYVGCDLSSCQTVTFPPLPATQDALTSLAVSATASSGLAVAFTSITPKTCAVSGNTVSLLFPGKCTILALQAGNDSFEPARPVKRTFTVNHAEQKIAFPPIRNQTQGAVVHLKATASSGLPVTFYSNSQGISLSTTPAPVCLVLGITADMLKPGTCTIGAYQAGNDLYSPASLTRSFTVTASQ